MATNNTRQPVPRGLYAPAVTNIPNQWSASWFRQFLTNHLQNADTRNSISGPGISVTGGILEPATISATLYVGLPYSILGNPTDSTAPDTDITATVAGQVLTFTGSAIEFGTLELANNIGLGPSFTVAGLNVGTVLQATQPDVAGFSAVTFPLAVTAGDVIVGIGADAIGSLPISTNGYILSIVDQDPAWVAVDTVAVTSVVGTTDEIDVVTTSGVATVSMDAAYVGQTSITTLGTVGTGVWHGTAIAVAYGGVPSTSGVTSGYVLTNASGTPTWEASAGGATNTEVVKGTFTSSTALIASASQDVYATCPVAGTIEGVRIFTVGGAGSCEVGVSKVAYASYPPVWSTNSICASDIPTISAGISYNDTTLTGWTTSVSAGDVIGFHLVSSSNFTSVQIQLWIQQTS